MASSVPGPLDEPRLIFHRPPPGVRLCAPGTPTEAWTWTSKVVKRSADAVLLSYGKGKWAAADRYHWVGFWPRPEDAVRALEKLRTLNKERIGIWRRQTARKKLVKAADILAPGAVEMVEGVSGFVEDVVAGWKEAQDDTPG